MIKNKTPLSMVEVKEYLKESDKELEVTAFIKKFSKIKIDKSKELKKKLEDLNLMKLNKVHLCKIIDFLPEKKEELKKVIPDANLDEDETKKVLDTIKEFK